MNNPVFKSTIPSNRVEARRLIADALGYLRSRQKKGYAWGVPEYFFQLDLDETKWNWKGNYVTVKMAGTVR